MPRADDVLGGRDDLTGSINSSATEQGAVGKCVSKVKEFHGKICAPDHPLNHPVPVVAIILMVVGALMLLTSGLRGGSR